MIVSTQKTWCMRAWVAVMLVAAATVTTLPAWGAIFSDIQGLPAQRAIERLVAKGIIRGTADGRFNPGGPVTRAELAVFLARALGLAGGGLSLPDFKDLGEISRDVQPAVAAMTHLGTVSPQAEGRGKVELRKGQVVYTLTTDKAVYGPTDVVELRFIIENTGKEDVKFEFAHSQFYDFVIRDGHGNETARWSVGKPFLPLDQPITLAAGKKFDYMTRWRQLDQNDEPTPPGRYEIIAVQTTKSNPTSLLLIFNKGVMQGFPDNTFRPKLEVTRAELAATVVRAMGLGEASVGAPGITDAAEIPAALRAAVAVAIEKRIVLPAADRAFRPAQMTTRADAAWALDVLMETLKRYDFSKGTLKDIRVGTPTLIVIEDDNKALRTFRVARAHAVYRNTALAELKDLKAGDALLFLKAGDVGDVAYVEATGR